ncbi:hypothetical protein KCU70_g275, partial [Aureobasidium melanogenum]
MVAGLRQVVACLFEETRADRRQCMQDARTVVHVWRILSTHNDAVACFQNNQRRKDQRTITVSSHCCASCSCGQYSPSHRSQAALGQQPRFQRFSLSQPYISPSALLSYTATIPSAHAQVIGLDSLYLSCPMPVSCFVSCAQ